MHSLMQSIKITCTTSYMQPLIFPRLSLSPLILETNNSLKLIKFMKGKLTNFHTVQPSMRNFPNMDTPAQNCFRSSLQDSRRCVWNWLCPRRRFLWMSRSEKKIYEASTPFCFFASEISKEKWDRGISDKCVKTVLWIITSSFHFSSQ